MPVDVGLDMRAGLVGAPPWHRAGYGGSHHATGKRPSLHHRGWTLVDVGHYRYAVKDGTAQRRRVCRTNEEQAVAIRKFRKVVDKMEDAS